MSEYLQENRRAVIMLVVALGVALLGGLYLLLSGGGEPTDTGAVPQGQRPTPSPTVETEEPTDPLVATVVARGSNVNPFGPLAGTEDDASDSGSEPTTTSKQSSPKKTSSYGTTNTDPSAKVDNSPSTTSDPVDVSGSDSADEKPTAEKNVVPKPINNGKDAEDGVTVAVVEVTGDYVVARVEGDRSKFYINIPGDEGVVYVAPLGGDCAWIGRTETAVRVSICEGKNGQL
jgi:hypothetical protein